MIINKKLLELKTFLQIIYFKNQDFSSIKENELRCAFKNNEYYNLKLFCLDNELIKIEYHEINLTIQGIEFFNILKKLKKL